VCVLAHKIVNTAGLQFLLCSVVFISFQAKLISNVRNLRHYRRR